MVNNRKTYWYGWIIIGNEDYAFAAAPPHHHELPEQIHHFTRDLEVNNDAFIRAMNWAYENPPWE